MKERCCARCFILLLPLLLFLISCACAAGITCEINPAGSSWIPGESALFEGCISADGTVSSDSATMKLSIRTDPVLSDPGTIVFSEVNGKKLSIRNQKDEYTVSLQAGSEIRFSGSWLIPENIHVSDIALVLTVLGPDGSILDEVSAPVSGYVSGSPTWQPRSDMYCLPQQRSGSWPPSEFSFIKKGVNKNEYIQQHVPKERRIYPGP